MTRSTDRFGAARNSAGEGNASSSAIGVFLPKSLNRRSNSGQTASRTLLSRVIVARRSPVRRSRALTSERRSAYAGSRKANATKLPLATRSVMTMASFGSVFSAWLWTTSFQRFECAGRTVTTW